MCKNSILKNKINCTGVDAAFCKMEEDFASLMNVIDAFHGVNHKPINRADLELFPLMEWVDIGGGIRIRKRKNRFKDYLNFDTEMEKGAEFGNHFHDDIIESCEVVKGLLFDGLTNKYYKKGDVAHYEKSERHEPIAIEHTFLHVLFKS